MQPHDFLARLLAKRGLNPHSVAAALEKPSLQSQLQRFLKNDTKEPRRSTLQPVAEFLNVELDAFYDPLVAQTEAERLHLLAPGGRVRSTNETSGEKLEKVTALPASLRPQNRSFLTHYPKSPPLVEDWADLGSSSVFASDDEEPFEALTVPGPFPNGYQLTRVPGAWMEPEIMEGDWIWVAKATPDDAVGTDAPHTVMPKNDDTVIAESTETGERFMGVYRRGYRASEFYITPKRGEKADSTKHPVRVLAVVMMQLKMLRGAGRATA